MQSESIKVADFSALPGNATNKNVPITNPDCSGVDVVIDITDEDLGGGAGSLTVTIEGVDPFGKKYTILASAALVAAARTVIRVGRGLTAAANLVANSQLPRQINFLLTHNNANPMTYTVSACLIP